MYSNRGHEFEKIQEGAQEGLEGRRKEKEGNGLTTLQFQKPNQKNYLQKMSLR